MPFLPVGLETASEAPRSAQTGPCRAFLRSAVHPAPRPRVPGLLSLLHTPPPCVVLAVIDQYSAGGTVLSRPRKQKKKGKKSWPRLEENLVNSCSCMQILANIFRIYPVGPLPSTTT